MKTTRKSTTPHLIYKALFLAAVIILFAAGGGLSIVWMRQQTANSAERIKLLEEDLNRWEERLRNLEARIATAHQPDYLKNRIKTLGLDLRAPKERQIIYLNTEYAAPKARKGPMEPIVYSYDLALIDSAAGNDSDE